MDEAKPSDASDGADQPPRRRRWRWRWRILAGLVLLILLATIPTVWERSVARPYLRDAQTVPNTPVALVFGARAVDGRPSDFLADRLDLAINLYTSHKIKVILVSGNDDGHGYDEPDVMRSYLIAHNIPPQHIVADHAGFTTWDTCARAHTVFGVDQAILVTQAFHIPRAVALCRANGVTGYGVGIDSMSVGPSSTIYGYAREYLAADKAMWDALVAKPAPDTLGPEQPAITDALRAPPGNR
jgi:vancomycin permeability regulator SanA